MQYTIHTYIHQACIPKRTRQSTLNATWTKPLLLNVSQPLLANFLSLKLEIEGIIEIEVEVKYMFYPKMELVFSDYYLFN